ncbi:ATP-binding protein [Pseudomonas tohonis]|uniref:ATP-binding protein n=1 Tax=Pseudomonas tohonis TaxID=2725477 RepID=UPI001F240705|nr:winged helix-turn-helix domain-containing protein [Pseudomonas tohonis]
MNNPTIFPDDPVLCFGTFRFHVQRRLLLEGERPLHLGSRALDILQLLLENAGHLVGKDCIIARVWPTTVVEESNLRVHIAALRRALGDGRDGRRFIANVPQRGYSFVAPVSCEGGVPAAAPGAWPAHNLPVRLTRIEGRDALVGALVREVPQRRFFTLAGPGGVGKTTVALRVAELLLEHYADGAHLIDLADCRADGVARHVAATLGLQGPGADPVADIGRQLCGRHALLVLDNCEHLPDAAALLAEGLLRRAPRLSILATSREPLLAEGEFVQRLAGLPVPPAPGECSVEQALGCAAIRLFVSRARARQDGFRLRPGDVPLVSEICRRLDGLPLAIELAAAQVDSLGLDGLQRLLDGPFQQLSHARRTAVPRHQSLRASLDWSYDLLTALERVVLQRLALFRQAFTFDGAARVIACERISETRLYETISHLVAKSLLLAEPEYGQVRYRLLETTRAYALDKLRDGGERLELHHPRTPEWRQALPLPSLWRGAPMQGVPH